MISEKDFTPVPFHTFLFFVPKDWKQSFDNGRLRIVKGDTAKISVTIYSISAQDFQGMDLSLEALVKAYTESGFEKTGKPFFGDLYLCQTLSMDGIPTMKVGLLKRETQGTLYLISIILTVYNGESLSHYDDMADFVMKKVAVQVA